jgi:hypothetical protein
MSILDAEKICRETPKKKEGEHQPSEERPGKHAAREGSGSIVSGLEVMRRLALVREGLARQMPTLVR